MRGAGACPRRHRCGRSWQCPPGGPAATGGVPAAAAGGDGLPGPDRGSSGRGSTPRRRRRSRRPALDLGRAPAPRFVSTVTQAPPDRPPIPAGSPARSSRSGGRRRWRSAACPGWSGGQLPRGARGLRGEPRRRPARRPGGDGARLARRAGAARGDRAHVSRRRLAPSAPTARRCRSARRRRSGCTPRSGSGSWRSGAAIAARGGGRPRPGAPGRAPPAARARGALPAGRRAPPAGPARRGHRRSGTRSPRAARPGTILAEIPFWRGVALARLGDLDGGLDLLNRFVATVPVTHPLRGDALVQAGWIALERKRRGRGRPAVPRGRGRRAPARATPADPGGPRPRLPRARGHRPRGERPRAS